MTQIPTRFDAPDLRRLRYFHGQLLSARDFQREQEYFREKLKLRMRSLLGYGVVCGLRVEPVPPPSGWDDNADEGHPDTAGAIDSDADPARSADADANADAGAGAEADADAEAEAGTQADGSARPTAHRPRIARVRLTAGLGVDCHGNEVIVHSGCEIDLWAALPAAERVGLPARPTLWIGVEYRERPVEPTRVVYDDGCGGPDSEPGWTQERFALRVTAHRPPADRRCDSGCESCEHAVLWLARIDDVRFHHPVRRRQIHQEIRRPFGRRVPTVITGVNWIQGHTYTVGEAQRLLGTHDERGGLVVRFSDDVRTGSLRPGVVDIQVIEGGAGRNASTWYMGGEFADLPDEEFTRDFRFRQLTREVLQDQDRVLITVRTAFLLDRCCYPVDGTHVGGRVPLIADGHDHHGGHGARRGGGYGEHQEHGEHGGHGDPPEFCELPPSGIGPWTSGSGAGGATFESWFFVEEGR